MTLEISRLTFAGAALGGFLLSAAVPGYADDPCPNGGGEPLGECRALIEINATDGDIGFHVLFDGEGWENAQIFDPGDSLIFDETVSDGTDAQLAMQKLTENFFESTEPLCEEGLGDEDEPVQTLPEFLALFPEGPYDFSLDGGAQTGTTMFTHDIPAAPADVDFDGNSISWEYGDDFGECTTLPADFGPIGEDEIIGYEVVLEPDDDDFPEYGPFTYSIRVPADVNHIQVPKAYLDSLPANIALKVEVGAIEERANGSFGNQTFSEEDGFCNNPSQKQCEKMEEDDDEEEEE